MAPPLLDHAELDPELRALAGARRWCVGFSGGVDSTVLLHLLQRWRLANPPAPTLCAIHVNHSMQDAADEWQVHCEWVCRLLRVPIDCRRVSVEPGSVGREAAAREARYRVFEGALHQGDVLFLGHHLDDQVETFFLRLLRGAGVHGLAAIPRQRPLGAGSLVRPLLEIPRDRLEAYAAHYGLRHVEDPSNRDTGLDRNFLRGRVLPLLAERWPGYRRTVARASEHMATTAHLLQEFLPAPATVHSVMGDPGIAVRELAQADAGAVKLRGWLRGLGMKAPERSLLEEFLRQLRETGPDASPRLQCGAFTLQRFREAVFLLPPPGPARQSGTRPLEPGVVLDLDGVGRLGLEPAAADGIALQSSDTPVLAWREGGERCRPVGSARRRSLKNLLQEAGVPPWWRERVPLLYLGDELLAVGDLWLCDSSRYRQRAGVGETLWRLSWERHIGPAFD